MTEPVVCRLVDQEEVLGGYSLAVVALCVAWCGQPCIVVSHCC